MNVGLWLEKAYNFEVEQEANSDKDMQQCLCTYDSGLEAHCTLPLLKYVGEFAQITYLDTIITHVYHQSQSDLSH